MREFDEALFKTKIDNIFIKIYVALTRENLKDIEHFVSKEVFEDLEKFLEDKKNKNQKQVYDEINVKNTTILNKKENDTLDIVEVELISRYMDYILDRKSGKIIEGTDQRRVERRNFLTFEKKKDSKEILLHQKCPNCGASMSINSSGVCKFCRSVFPLEEYDYILTSLTTEK